MFSTVRFLSRHEANIRRGGKTLHVVLKYLSSTGNLSPTMGTKNQVGIGLSYWPASLCSLATQFQTRFLESIPRSIAGLKFLTLLSKGVGAGGVTPPLPSAPPYFPADPSIFHSRRRNRYLLQGVSFMLSPCTAEPEF
jgi:hypothetical protein